MTRYAGYNMLLELPQVTLCCVDAINHRLALRALERCRNSIRFARTVFLTDALPADVDVPLDIDVVRTGPITSHEDYSRIVLKNLLPHVRTSHVLLVQWDGYVINPDRWQTAFLENDYIGAPWPGKDGNPRSVGNGGFSLRSRRLLEALQDDRFELMTNTEDVTICGIHKPRLVSEFGIRFADVDLAKQFSFEMGALRILAGGNKTFGFHGIFNLFLAESPDDIAAMTSQFSDSIAKSMGVNFLLKNLVLFEMWQTAVAVGSRILAAAPDDDEVANLVLRARERIKQKNAEERVTSSLVCRLADRFKRR
jgi:hypothetical protein